MIFLACGSGHGTPAPTFSLAAVPGQVRLLPGLSQSVTLTLQPEPGFKGEVEFSVTGQGSGVEARFNPASLALAEGASAKTVLTLKAAEDAPPGSRSVTLQATGSGQAQVAEVAVDIPRASFFTVATFRGPDPANFSYLAYQDGDGPWTGVAGIEGLYRLPITDPGGRFGVLLGDSCKGLTTSSWITNGFFSTLGEVQMLQAMVFCSFQPGPPPETFDLRGALAGAPGRDILISANSGVWSFPAGTTDYAMKLIKGHSDLVAAAYPDTRTYVPSRIIVERGREAQSPGTRDFDFGSQGGDPLTPVLIQRPALEADEVFQGTVQYLTSGGQSALLGFGQDLAAYAPFPPSAAQSGDAYLYRFQATGPQHSRTIQASGNQSPGPLAPKFPSNVPPFSFTASSGSASRLSLSWDTVVPVPSVHEAVLTQQFQGKQVYCYLYFGRTWHQGAARLSWTQPDLSSTPGFEPSFLPQAGAAVQATLYQSGLQVGADPSLRPGLPGQNLFPFQVPPGRAFLVPEPPGLALIRMKAQGSPAKAAAGVPWSEYWTASRSQTLIP